MSEHAVPFHPGPAEVRHRIHGERFDDLPVHSIEVLMHRRVRLSQWALEKASDPYWRLYWPLGSGGTVVYDGRHTPLAAGRLYLIPPHTAFDSRVARQFSKWYIHFALRGAEQVPAPGVYEIALIPRLKTLLSRTCPRTGRADAVPSPALAFQVIEMIALTLAHAPDALWKGTLCDRRLETALLFMNRNLHRSLTLQELSKESGLSPRGLTKLFVTHTSLAPIRYLIELRLNHCCRLLQHSTLSIEEIAEQCGFANRYYLSRMMRKYRHTSPAAFRARADSVLPPATAFRRSRIFPVFGHPDFGSVKR